MTLYSARQLAQAAGRSRTTLWRHVDSGYLIPVDKKTLPGVRGPRFSEAVAKKWLNRFYPGKKLPTP